MSSYKYSPEAIAERRARPVEPADPCVFPGCGTTGGHTREGRRTPSRFDASQFGLTGRVCMSHYITLRKRRQDRLDPLSTEAIPCEFCGTTGGHIRENHRRPERRLLERDGKAGYACHACLYGQEPLSLEVGTEDPEGARRRRDAAIRREAWAILSKRARPGDEMEERRLEEIERGPVATDDVDMPALVAEAVAREEERAAWDLEAIRCTPPAPVFADASDREPAVPRRWLSRRFLQPTERFHPYSREEHVR